MPGGLTDPVIGFSTFAAVKFIGYTALTIRMKKSYPEAGVSAFTLGLTRTGIGVAFGFAYGLATTMVITAIPSLGAVPWISFLLYAGLYPVRLLEWWILIWFFLDRTAKNPASRRRWRHVGTWCSYALDIPALAGFLATGGLWIC
ncbi:MAG: hypothetical protein O7H41_20175 [Planctomycetota bacterium]|nr:hypothetical protein [Planctomycetota bacterium]